MSALEIRPATADDSGLILHFIKELAIYERAEEEVSATESDIRDSLFETGSSADALICTQDGVVIGFAVYFFNYSTWQGKDGLYLEDLYVTPEHRKNGAGRAILQYLAAFAVARGCGRFEWSVLDWNEPAIQFYQAIGAQPQDEWIRYRLAGKALREFAAEESLLDTPSPEKS